MNFLGVETEKVSINFAISVNTLTQPLKNKLKPS